jgi:biotin transport system substrate-specific component
MLRSESVHAGAQPVKLVTESVSVILGSIAIALLAQLSVPLQPVPVTGQTLGVLAVAWVLGARRGTSAIALYLAYGAAGLPVFANGGASAAVFFGPTGGYLVGFLLVGFCVGVISDRYNAAGTRRLRRITRAGSARRTALVAGSTFTFATVVIYLCGTAQLSRFVGWDAVWTTGVAPFLPGDAIKIGILTIGSTVLNQRGRAE